MKKLLTTVIAVIVLGAVFAGCAPKGDWDYIEKRGKIILGFDPHFPPMGFFESASETDASKAVGFDIDVAKEVAAILGVELELVSIEWSKKETELKSKNIDMIWNGYTMNETRASNHLFTVPYMKNEQAVIVLKENANTYTTIDSLKTAKVSYQKNSSAEPAVASHEVFKNNTAIVADNYGKALTELESKNVDFVVMDSIAAAHYIKEQPNKYHQVAGISLGNENYGIGIRQGASLTLYKINEALFSLRDSGRLLEIATEWGLQDDLLLK